MTGFLGQSDTWMGRELPRREEERRGALADVPGGVPEASRLGLEPVLRLRSPRGGRASIDLDRKSAGQVQRRLMGASLPPGVGVTADTAYLPAFDVGGDFYELVHLGDGIVAGAIGDVSGKGVAAALIMSRVSLDFRRALRTGSCPAEVLESVNADLTDLDPETFVTGACFRLDSRRRRLTVANAGHIPFVVRRAAGEVFTFGWPSGTPLGMVTCHYCDEELDLEPRDIVVLMTDGLLEALGRAGDCMGSGRLLRLVRSVAHDPKVVNASILEAASRRKGGRPLDDMTLVSLQLA